MDWTVAHWLAAAAGAFVLGSIPTGYLIGRAYGIDIRRVGSGNIGATNVGRVLGPKAWFLCFSGDLLKGLVPVLVAGVWAGVAGKWILEPMTAALWCVVVVGAVLGHMFCPWLGFRGGKGVATALGSLLGVFPILTVAGIGAVAVFVILLSRWRYVSLASMGAAASLPLLVLGQSIAVGPLGLTPIALPPAEALARSLPLVGVLTLLAGVMIFKHRGNMGRILAGTEPRVGQKRAAGRA